MALPTALTGFNWVTDGVAWVGPFISSAGNVYVLTDNAGGAISMLKATDPTTSFSAAGTGFSTSGGGNSSRSAHQVGDVLHIVGFGATNLDYGQFDMSTDTMSQPAGTTGQTVSGVVNGACACAKRAAGNDVIVLYNASGVVNMGKTYGRIAARRIAGGTSWGAQTDVGIGTVATTQQVESADSVVLGSSDRVHLFWTQGNATAGSNSNVQQRTVLSTDNLDGTAPATALQTVATAFPNSLVDGPGHISGQAFLSSGGVIAVPFNNVGATFATALGTATSAATPSWTNVAVSAAATKNATVGATTNCASLGGAPYDGTNKTVAWVDSGAADPMYDKDTGGGFGTDVTIATVTATQVSANVYQRGTNIVLALVYDQSAGTWVYDEVVLRSVVVVPPPYVNSMPQLIAQ